jgi:hypothetical protein
MLHKTQSFVLDIVKPDSHTHVDSLVFNVKPFLHYAHTLLMSHRRQY